MAHSKFISENTKYAQNDLFQHVLREVHLFAPNSPRKAFYSLSLGFEFSHYTIYKKSGIGSKVLDRRKWVYGTLPEAEKSFSNRLKQKTRPDRKSPRKYVEIKQNLDLTQE